MDYARKQKRTQTGVAGLQLSSVDWLSGCIQGMISMPLETTSKAYSDWSDMQSVQGYTTLLVK